MATKTKIRLLLDANAMQRVGRLPEVRAVRRGRANKRRLRAVYFDTPAADLRQAGATLWTRKEGGRWIQALRLDGHAAGGMDLQEWPLAGRTLDLKVLRETGAPRVFRDARFRKALDAVFETDFIRTSIALVLTDGTRGELRLDSGEVIAGKRRAPISEIEIELVEGDRARLFDFAIGLVEALPVRVADAGKAARGYALMLGLSAVPVKARIPALSEGMHVEDAFAEIGRSCLAQMQANETGVGAARDLEFLHQYRVGLRRLRSAFGLFRPVLARGEYGSDGHGDALAERLPRAGARLGRVLRSGAEADVARRGPRSGDGSAAAAQRAREVIVRGLGARYHCLASLRQIRP